MVSFTLTAKMVRHNTFRKPLHETIKRTPEISDGQIANQIPVLNHKYLAIYTVNHKKT